MVCIYSGLAVVCVDFGEIVTCVHYANGYTFITWFDDNGWIIF